MSVQNPRTPTLGAVRSAYGTWAAAYIEWFGSPELAPSEDRELIEAWAEGLSGPVLDVGCGPGHWSAHLHGRGLEVEGVDATPEFLEHARAIAPGVPFRMGDLRQLDLADASLGGVLAWFSVIHTDPGAVPGVLRALAGALRPGGSLLLGFFSTDASSASGHTREPLPFDHRVVTAWAWPVQTMVEAVEATGLDVVLQREWPTANGRRNAAIVAMRRG